MATVNINLNGDLIEQARTRAAAAGKSVDELIEIALAELVKREETKEEIAANQRDAAREFEAFLESIHRDIRANGEQRPEPPDLLDEIFEIADQARIRPEGKWLTDEEMYDR